MQIDLYSHYVQIIKENINKYNDKELIIFPFGEQGMLFKNILNYAYGIHEKYIIDNQLCKYNKHILSLHQLKNILCEKMLFFLTTTDKDLNKELYHIIETEFPDCEIINVIEPVVIPVTNKAAWFREIIDLLAIKQLKPDRKYIRIGNMNDGGYIMLDDFNAKMHAYSFGISNDVSWDKEMAERYGISVYMYDHTISRLPEYNEKFHYYKAGISGKDDYINNVYSMKTLLKNNDDITNKNLVLKMDVEGAEYGFLEITPSAIIDNFRQIVLELHNITRLENKDNVKKGLKKLNETHQAVWVHGNNFNYAEFDNNIIMPNTIEVLYLNKNYYGFTESEVYFPWELDNPNRNMLNDFILGNWGKTNEYHK